MTEVIQRFSHSQWAGKYPVVFVPNRRCQGMFGHLRQQLGPPFRWQGRVQNVPSQSTTTPWLVSRL